MRISSQQIASLKVLLRELHGIELTDEQAQEAGMAIMRFVTAKAQREQSINKARHKNEQQR
jgi:Tetracyclin repressor-like, C-terminal domain